jgi:hypothetical protein
VSIGFICGDNSEQALRVTPAMAAGEANKLWEIEDIGAMID